MPLAEVLEQAMKLPTDDRAALAHELLASLESGRGESRESAPSEEWVKKIQARIDRFERGETQARPWREVMDELDKELLARIERMDRGEAVPRDCKAAVDEIRARRKKTRQ